MHPSMGKTQPAEMVASESKLKPSGSAQPYTSKRQLPSSTLAVATKFEALDSVQEAASYVQPCRISAFESKFNVPTETVHP